MPLQSAGLSHDFDINFAWKWMRRMEELANSNCYAMAGLRPEHPYQFGAQFCLNVPHDPGKVGAADTDTLTSELTLELSSGDEHQATPAAIRCTVYGGKRRQLVMRMCGWDAIAGSLNEDESIGSQSVQTFSPLHRQTYEEGLERLESDGQHGKAAAFAVFAFDLQRAVQSLNRSARVAAAANRVEASARLRLAGLALAGYRGATDAQQMQQWQETCDAMGVLVTSSQGGEKDNGQVIDTTRHHTHVARRATVRATAAECPPPLPGVGSCRQSCLPMLSFAGMRR